MALLDVRNVDVGYTEGVQILRGLSMQIQPNELVALIGPNGAGKSTALKTLFGFLHPWRGQLIFDQQDITLKAPFLLKRLGISYIPQNLNIFAHLSVEENLKLGAWTFRKDKARLKSQLERTYDTFPILHEFKKRPANALSGGQAKMLSIAKEVMNDPKLVLVDEPTAALAPKIADETYAFLQQTRQLLGASMLLVDHHMEKAINMADRVYVLSLGRMVVEGPAQDFSEQRLKEIIRQCLLGAEEITA